jgi:hypothetical protein
MLKHKLTVDEVKSWLYCGGRSHPECMTQKMEYESYFLKLYPNANFLEFEDECVCGQDIMHNAYIRKNKHSSVNDIIIVGSCCVEAFTDNKMARICDKCGKKHTSRYTTEGNKCAICRKQDAKIDKIYKKQFDELIKEIKYTGSYDSDTYGMRIRIPKIRNAIYKAENDERVRLYELKIKQLEEEAKIKKLAELAKRVEFSIKQIMADYKLPFEDAIKKAKSIGLRYDGERKVWYK